MHEDLIDNGARSISLFCRQNINTKKNLPIRSSEMGLLIYVIHSDEPVSPIMAADFFKVSKPMVTNMITSLIRKKYLVKQPSGKDKRSYFLIPTQNAKELVTKAFEEYAKVIQTLINGMGETKYKKLIKLLDAANSLIAEME